MIHKINDEEFVYELNWKMASNDEKIKKILINDPLYNIQTSFLVGN